MKKEIANVGSYPKTLEQGKPDFSMETDASMRGWGAYYNGSITQGQWATDESNLHINVMELKAVLFGFKKF